MFREVCGAVAKMAVFILLFFGLSPWRTPAMWWIGPMALLAFGGLGLARPAFALPERKTQ